MRRARATIVSVAAMVVAASCGGGGSPGDASPGSASTAGSPYRDGPPVVPGDANTAIGDEALPALGDRDLDVLDYELDLAFVPTTGELAGRATITFGVRRPVSRISLDATGLDITSVTTDGDTELAVSTTPTKLSVDLGGVMEPSTIRTIGVAYSTVPAPIPTAALGDVAVGWQSRPGHSFVLAEPDAARTWYPVNDHPTDKATYTIAVSVPDDRVVLANGVLVGTGAPDAGVTRWVYRMDAPMAPYLATVVTGPYAEADPVADRGVAQTFWAASSTRAEATLAEQVEILAWFTDWLGPFPFATYAGVHLEADLVEPFFNTVAFESQTLSIFGSQALATEVIVHEAAHQWIGNSVSLTDWSKDIWWVEGFAHFAEWRFLEATRGPAAYRRMVETSYGELRAARRPLPAGALPLGELFSDWSYVRGALTFVALRDELGDSVFDAFLRAFVDRYRHANATTQDLIAVAEEVSGKDLGALFDAWLFTPALPAPPT